MKICTLFLQASHTAHVQVQVVHSMSNKAPVRLGEKFYVGPSTQTARLGQKMPEFGNLLSAFQVRYPQPNGEDGVE